MRAMRIEVRCCCSPKKLLGWVHLPQGAWDRRICLPMRATAPAQFDRHLSGFAPEEVGQVTLSFARLDPGNGDESYLCLKAEGLSIETLRKLACFEENCAL